MTDPLDRAGVDVDAAALAIKDLLGAFGVPDSDHTRDTHTRSAKAWAEMLSGYLEDPADHLDTTFEGPLDPGLVVVAGIRIQAVCAHHLLPFGGFATVAYRPSPGARIVGLSKLARVVVGYSRRLQVQEQIGYDTVHALMDRLNPAGAAVVITAAHNCMGLRGAREDAALTTTWANAGMLLEHERSLIREQHEHRVSTL